MLLPNNEIRLEFENDISKNIIESSEMFHNNKILVVSQLIEKEKIDSLPSIGVISVIKHRLELPNGRVRLVIKGIKRAQVYEYMETTDNEMLDAIIAPMAVSSVDEKEEFVLVKKLQSEVESYVRMIPYISNSVLGIIDNIYNLSVITDTIVPYLSIDVTRVVAYLYENDSKIRAKMIVEDIYRDKEKYDIEKSIDVKVKKGIEDNQKEYLLREKIKVIKEELGDVAPKEDEVAKLEKRIKDSKAPIKIKERLQSELKRYEALPQSSPEINMIRNYIEWLLTLPFNEITEDNEDLISVKSHLDASHYGLEKVKTRIVEFLAVKQMTKSLRSPIICLVGPPGVGKTSLAFSIAEAMKRNFVKMSVGGVNDEAEIIGHRRAYLGSSPGRIIQAMKKAKSSNPVFLIDEIDKMTKDVKGDPASVLLEILDPEQNRFFSDNYIEEEYDLSNVMFVATANYIDDIPEALKDRLEIINLSGYTEFEKLDIAKNHLVPKVCDEHGLPKEKIIIKDNIILNVIRNYTKEAGVRELERQLANIIRKVVYDIIINKNDKKYIITDGVVMKYLGKEKYNFNEISGISEIGVVNGLAYTYFGGDTLPIEVNFFKGNGSLMLTGSLGDVMKESAQIALAYIKSNSVMLGIDYDALKENDIHIHVPEGAVRKDGPSAGITLTTALVSAFSGISVPFDLAMTGEITLRGKVLPIGGLKEKSIGALRSGIKTIIMPFNNLNDLDEIPNEVKDKINYIPVKTYDEIYKIIKTGQY